MLAAVLKRTGQPRKPKGKGDRKGDLTEQFSAQTTGRGFGSSPTPARGKPVDKPGRATPWPRGKSLEQRESGADDLDLRRYR